MAEYCCFNPRTRESATNAGGLHFTIYQVSIHALVRVRLPQDVKSCIDNLVSIHALVRVRHICFVDNVAGLEFQSTHS